MQALVLPIGDDRYALELADVREVVPEPRLTPLPGAPRSVLGLLNVRGEVIPVLDTARLLGLPPANLAFALIAECDAGLAGLAIGAEPAVAQLGEPAGEGRFAHAGGVVSRLALDELVAPDRLAAA